MSDLLQVFLLSMTPVGELRLAIPMGIMAYNIDAATVFFVSVIGNLIPAIFLLFFLKKLSVYLSGKSIIFKRIFTWWETRAREKHITKIEKYDVIGLALFIAIPLPLTGAWTGALLATIMDLPVKKSLPAVLIGVVGAGVIVTTAVIAGVNIEKYFGLQALASILLIIIAIFALRKFLIKK